MQITYRTFLGASAIAVVAAATIAGAYIWNQMGGNGEIAAYAPLDTSCDIQKGPCQALFPDGGRISLSIDPRPIQGLQPLQIQVTTTGLEAREVAVDFRGLGMSMGYNRPRLKKNAEGQFSGSGMLSVCVLQRMSWEATVLATSDRGVMAAPFQFETVSP